MYRRELEINGTSLSFETGKYAKQADGSVIVRMGDSVVLVTACASPNPREGIDFLPLTVDYKEYTYASGRIPGGFFKREGKPSEKEVLTSRVIDRPIRPLFPAGWRNESQIIALVLSADANYDPDVLAISGASAALALSSVPFQKTIAGVRVGKVEGQYVINPTYEQRRKSSFDLVMAGSKDAIVMVEAGAKEVTEEEMVQGLEAGHAAIKKIVDTIDALAKEAGKPKREVPKKEVDHAFYREVEEKVLSRSPRRCACADKLESYSTVDQVLERSRRGHSRRRNPAQGRSESRSSKSSRRRCCATKCSRRAFVSTAASSTRSGPSGPRSACFPAFTARLCLRAARRRRSSP